MVGAKCRQEEHYAGREEGLLASESRCHKPGNQCTYDAADKSAGCGEAVQTVGVAEISRTAEECLQTSLCTGNHRSIISEKQAAYHGYQHYAGKIGPATRLSVTSHLYML